MGFFPGFLSCNDHYIDDSDSKKSRLSLANQAPQKCMQIPMDNRRVGRGVSSLPGNPPFRLFSGRGSSSGARIYACARDASRAVYTYINYTRAHTYLFPVLSRCGSL